MAERTRVSVVFASDTVTAMPMTVAAAALPLAAGLATDFDVHVLSCGIPAVARQRFERTLADLGEGRVQSFWHEIEGPRAALLRSLYTRSDRPYPPAAYARLLAGEVLPAGLDRVIYMDSDTLALADLAGLWHEPFEGAAALVIRDLPHDSGQAERLARTLSAEDRARFGVDPAELLYFQSGVMVLDLAALRAGAAEEMLALLARYPQLTFPDQDALNIVFARRCRAVDPRWNSMAAVYWSGDPAAAPYDPATMAELRERPFVAHYSGRPKPWEEGCSHPLAARWEAVHARTTWADRRRTLLTRAFDRIPRARRVLGKKLRRALGF